MPWAIMTAKIAGMVTLAAWVIMYIFALASAEGLKEQVRRSTSGGYGGDSSMTWLGCCARINLVLSVFTLWALFVLILTGRL